MKISTIIREAHATAVDKGWHDEPVCTRPGFPVIVDGVSTYAQPEGVDVRAVASFLLMIHTEIGEAWECYHNSEIALTYDGPKPTGLPSELADVVIRIADLAGALGLPQPIVGEDTTELIDLRSTGRSLDQEHFSVMRHCIDRAVDYLRKPDLDGMLAELVVLLAECQRMAVYFDIDLSSAVRVKMAFNRTRPHRHGGKAL